MSSDAESPADLENDINFVDTCERNARKSVFYRFSAILRKNITRSINIISETDSEKKENLRVLAQFLLFLR